METVELRCKNFWCKAIFNIKEEELVGHNSICKKCNSFDTECSGGIESSTKDYEGTRLDGTPHTHKTTITNWK